MEKTKKCIGCNKIKDACDFYIVNKKTGSLRSYCKTCTIKKAREFDLKNPEQKRKRSYKSNLKYRKNSPEKFKQSQAKYYTNNKTKIQARNSKIVKEKDFGLYSIYISMKRRCNYKSQYGYKWYGGKGIKVEWLSYKDFRKDMYESYIAHIEKYTKKQTTLDRINNDKNYCKDNCRWATWEMQANNRGKEGELSPTHNVQKKTYIL